MISGTLASAFDSGHSRLAAAAISWNRALSMPGTVACMVNAMRSITKPSPCWVSRTRAVVSIDVTSRAPRPTPQSQQFQFPGLPGFPFQAPQQPGDEDEDEEGDEEEDEDEDEEDDED